MSDPTGLRAAIRAYALTTSNVYWEPEEWAILPEAAALDAALTAVEALVAAAATAIARWEDNYDEAKDWYPSMDATLDATMDSLKGALAALGEETENRQLEDQ